jgi:putative transposase
MNLAQFNDLKRLAMMYRTGRISLEFVAAFLKISPRHALRLMKNLTPPKSRGGLNRISSEMRNYVIEQRKDNLNYNCQWLSELASDRFGRSISQSTVWRILHSEKLLDRIRPTPVLRKRFEAEASGDLVQMDTTWGYWLGNKRLYLTVLLDDHSRYLLAAKWALSETLWHNMTIIREIVEKYGCFKVLYTDNASWFKVIRHNRSIYQNHQKYEYESEITRACRELGIVHVTHKPYEPQGKGKVERIFRFIQERFVTDLDSPEMPLYVINKKFQTWMEWYNTKHVNRTIGSVPKKRFDPGRFEPLSGTKRRQLDDIFCVKDTRTVDTCNQFNFEGTQYHIPGERSYAHRTVTLHVHPGYRIRVFYQGKFLTELLIPQHV